MKRVGYLAMLLRLLRRYCAVAASLSNRCHTAIALLSQIVRESYLSSSMPMNRLMRAEITETTMPKIRAVKNPLM